MARPLTESEARYDTRYWDNDHTVGLGSQYIKPNYLRALAMAESSDRLSNYG